MPSTTIPCPHCGRPMPGGVLGRVNDIVQETETAMALPEGAIRSRNRSARVVTARSVACYRIRRELGASLPEIASLLRRDHTTVRDGVLRVEAAIARGDATVIWLACRRRAA